MKMKHADFIAFLADRDIQVEKITRNCVYIKDARDPGDVDLEWSCFLASAGKRVTLREAVMTDSRLFAIAILRRHVDSLILSRPISLLDLKNLVDKHWHIWRDMVGAKSCRQISG
jgi:hypothetical protein